MLTPHVLCVGCNPEPKRAVSLNSEEAKFAGMSMDTGLRGVDENLQAAPS